MTVTWTSDIAPVSSKEFFNTQTTIELWIHSESRTWHNKYIQMHRTVKYSPHCSIIWPVSLNDSVFVYELSGSGFESRCRKLLTIIINVENPLHSSVSWASLKNFNPLSANPTKWKIWKSQKDRNLKKMYVVCNSNQELHSGSLFYFSLMKRNVKKSNSFKENDIDIINFLEDSYLKRETKLNWFMFGKKKISKLN